MRTRVRLLKDFVIPAGTVFNTAPHTTTRDPSKCFLADLEVSKDSTARFEVNLDCVSERPDLFARFEASQPAEGPL